MRQTFAGWPVLMGRTIFYLVIMAVLSSFWDKVSDARLAGTLAVTLSKGALTLYVGVTEWITLSVAAGRRTSHSCSRMSMLPMLSPPAKP